MMSLFSLYSKYWKRSLFTSIWEW